MPILVPDDKPEDVEVVAGVAVCDVVPECAVGVPDAGDDIGETEECGAAFGARPLGL